MPTPAIAIGSKNATADCIPARVPRNAATPSAAVARIEPQYDSYRSAPMPATSPTLSPTLSAIVAGLRGSSSGMPGSTLPTRSAPDVRGLGEDAAAHAGKQRLAAGTHAEAEHGHGDLHQAVAARSRSIGTDPVQKPNQKADVEQAEADDGQAHDRAAAEGDLQALVERLLAPAAVRLLACVAVFMPNQPASPREEAAREERERHEVALHLQAKRRDAPAA